MQCKNSQGMGLNEYESGDSTLKINLKGSTSKNIQPPPKLSLSAWANTFAVLSKETSAQTGRFRAFPYQNGMMDAITDPAVTKVSVMKSARVGYTKILDHAVGYFVHQDPSPILIVQPRVEDAEDYSKTELSPMLRDTPVLAEITGDFKAKDSDNTILKKTFRNGSSITLVGANSPGGFRRITARVICFDEVDGYPVGGAGAEGDQIALGTKRSETFWNRRIVLGSTPTIKGYSRIEKSFEESDQRYYYVPCPHCDEFQRLVWGGKETAHGIRWDKDEQGHGLPDTAHYVCLNGCIIDESDKHGMIGRGEWRALKPFKDHAGFHIWAGYSLFPNASWSNLAAEWLRVKDDALARQTFYNLVLGEPYDDKGDKAVGTAKLLAQCEVWAGDVPDGVGVLTVGADMQDDRIELEVVGWGKNEESWSVDYHVIRGDPDTQSFWADVDDYLKATWKRADGRRFEIMSACIDSGGHYTQQVYNFCKARIGRKIWAVKGESARGGQRSPVWPTKKPKSKDKSTYRPIILGVNTAKDSIRNRLHLDHFGAGYMHFPTKRDLAYFDQLTAERMLTKTIGSVRTRIWDLPSGRRNEALDCRVYAYGALCGLMHMGLKLNQRVERVQNEAFVTYDNELIQANVTSQIEKNKPQTVVKRPSLISRLA